MKRDFRETMFVRLWALKNVFLLWFVRPSVVEVNEDRCVARIPLSWRTKNHLGSMYFGALLIGADLCGGLIAFHLMRVRKVRYALVFKDVRGEFLKRPEADVVFTCEDGAAIRRMMTTATETGERQETPVTVIARCPSKLGEEPVARFTLTLSVKAR